MQAYHWAPGDGQAAPAACIIQRLPRIMNLLHSSMLHGCVSFVVVFLWYLWPGAWGLGALASGSTLTACLQLSVMLSLQAGL